MCIETLQGTKTKCNNMSNVFRASGRCWSPPGISRRVMTPHSHSILTVAISSSLLGRNGRQSCIRISSSIRTRRVVIRPFPVRVDRPMHRSIWCACQPTINVLACLEALAAGLAVHFMQKNSSIFHQVRHTDASQPWVCSREQEEVESGQYALHQPKVGDALGRMEGF